MSDDKTSAPLRVGRFAEAEQRRSIYSAVVPTGVTLDDVLAPTYWVHVARRLRPYDRIEVTSEDGAFWAELLVLRSSTTDATVRKIHSADLDPLLSQVQGIELDMTRVVHRGQLEKWAVVRTQDGAILRSGMENKSAAIQFATQYEQQQAAQPH